MFPKLKLLGEVQQGLAPILQQLGLQARMREWMGYPAIQFETPDGTMKSPIRLVLENKNPVNRAGSRWKGHAIHYTGFDERPLPGSDWTYVRFAAFDRTYLNESDDISLKLLARELLDYNLTFTEDHPKATYDEDFFKTYNSLRRALRKFGDMTVECRRHEGAESQHFTDLAGRTWQLEFKDNVTVLVDGVSVKEFEFRDIQALLPFIRRDLSKIAPQLDSTNNGMRL